MKQSNALAHLRQLCALELPAAEIVPAFLRALRQLVPAHSAAFFWVDAHGDIANLYAERLLPLAEMRGYFEQHYAGDVHAFRDRLRERVRQQQWVVQIDAARALADSAYYRDVLRPLDAERILQALVHQGDQVLGQLSLYRDARGAAFKASEIDAVHSAARYLGQALTRPHTAPATTDAAADAMYRNSGEEALVVCDASGEIAQASPRAHALLAHAAGETLNRRTLAGPLDRAVGQLLRRALRPLERMRHGSDTAETFTANVWGRHRLCAYSLGAQARGVLVQRQEHLLLRMADAMRDLPLSAQQREVALWLARGLTNGQVAARLGVSTNTANYHVKQLFAKLDAHDRNAAIARILNGHTARQ
jgi:DNA-binding CsgD family transcriptional regulator